LQNLLDPLSIDADAVLKNKLAGFFNFAMTSFIIDPLSCLAVLEINLRAHLGDVFFLDQAAGARAFTEKLDASQQDPVLIDIR
jgi:hypothetical protein